MMFVWRTVMFVWRTVTKLQCSVACCDFMTFNVSGNQVFSVHWLFLDIDCRRISINLSHLYQAYLKE